MSKIAELEKKVISSSSPLSPSTFFPSTPPPPAPSHPSKAEAEKTLGNASFKTGDYASALSYYDSALSFDPSDPLLLNNRAAALISLSRLSEALSCCDDALAAADSVAADKATRAKIYRRAASAHDIGGNLEKAVAAYREAQEWCFDDNCAKGIDKLERRIARAKAEAGYDENDRSV